MLAPLDSGGKKLQIELYYSKITFWIEFQYYSQALKTGKFIILNWKSDEIIIFKICGNWWRRLTFNTFLAILDSLIT